MSETQTPTTTTLTAAEIRAFMQRLRDLKARCRKWEYELQLCDRVLPDLTDLAHLIDEADYVEPPPTDEELDRRDRLDEYDWDEKMSRAARAAGIMAEEAALDDTEEIDDDWGVS